MIPSRSSAAERSVRTSRSGSLVTSSPMWVIAVVVTSSAPIAASSSRPISASSPRVKTTRPSATTCTTSAAVAANTAVCSSAPVPAVRGLAVSRVTRSARCPTAIDPASANPRLAWPVAAASSSAAVQCPRSWLASRSSISRPRISSNGSITAWLSLPSVIRQPACCSRAGGTDAVGEVALGGGRDADVGAGGAEQLDVVVGEVGRVHDRGVGAEEVRLVQQPGRGDAVRREAGLVLGDLLGEVHVQRRAARGRPAAGRAAPPGPSGSPPGRRPRAPPRPRRRRRSSAAAPPPAASRTRWRGSRCRAARSAARPRGRPRSARGPSRWGRRTACRRAGGAGSGTPPPR